MRHALAALAAIVIIAAVAAPGHAGEAVTLVVAMAERPPWRMLVGGEARGVEVDILRDVARRMGVELRFEPCSEPQCTRRLRRGEADVVAGRPWRREHEKFLVYVTPPYVTGTTSAFYTTRRRAPTIVRYEYLRALRIGVARGERHFPQFDHDRELRKTVTKGVADGFRRLVAGAVSVVVAEEYQADWWLAAHPRTDALVAKTPLAHREYDPLHFAFSARSPHVDLAPALGEALAAMIQDGALERHLQAYARP